MLVMLDRDGVLNEETGNYVKTPGELVMIAGSAGAVRQLNDAGHRVVVCTNQSCIGKGIIDVAMLERIHAKLHGELAAAGARLDDLLVAPDAPWAATERRKPGPGMLLEAMRRFRASPADAVFIGDSLRDLQAAAKVGCRRILVRTGNGAKAQADGIPADVLPVSVYGDLAAAVAALLKPPP
ncbi:MAG TPA: HAD-IIIA family hydrolase [Candidatus Cybelea sp.]|nr:HAD-IIIA family hydrolase [Candidatus Cybelea sp.]